MRLKAVLTALMLMVISAGIGTSTANAHAPWKHPHESLYTPKLHYLKFLKHEIVEERDSNCRLQPQPRSVHGIATWNRSRYILKWRDVTLPRVRAESSRCIPITWWASIRYVQAVYPGTQSWLDTCSGAEGGHTAYVQNKDGANVWGWMQFNPGTFSAYVGDAFRDARRRGLYAPSSEMRLNSPLGQAITAGYMRYTDRDDSHWQASWGNGC